jgi:hypothetical protein
MKSQLNPAIAIGVIVVIVLVAGFLIMKKSGTDSGYAAPDRADTKASKAQK